MVLWPIILGSALGGGLLVLHGFSKCKAASEQMLKPYREMLKAVAARKSHHKGDQANSSTGKRDSEAATGDFNDH